MLRYVALLLLSSLAAPAQVSVLTNRYDNSRTGWNPKETILNASNVNTSRFGKVFSYVVDGSVFAQPLYVPNVAIPNQGTHNVLYVVTMSDSVYAFDADQNLTLWHVNFTNPASGITPVPISDITGSNNLNITGSVGIESTPVIDPASQTIYLVARTKEVTSSATNYVQRLHALDITTGAEKFGGPVVIAASVPGTGEESVNGQVPFDPFWQNQRPGLALTNGQIIIAWSSHEDDQPYHGWVMAYNASTLAQTGAFCDTPDGQQGGIWMAGRAPVVDAQGNVYLLTGNGSTDKSNDFSECALRLSTKSGGLALGDFFTASNAGSLNNGDEDLGSGGLLMIPTANMLIGGGKQGVLYLLNPANLGHYVPNDTQIPQKFQAVNNLIFTGPAYWQSASMGQLLYIWAMGDVMRAFAFNGTTFNTAPVIQSTVQTPSGSDPGAALTISSSGTTDSSAIVWASMPISQDADHGLATGMLRAINALTGAELWNSQMVPSRDATGPYFAKFVPPTVANGKVYMANFTDYTLQTYVDVYGLMPVSAQFTLSIAPAGELVTPGGTAIYTVNVNPKPGYNFTGTVNFAISGLPAGATAAFTPPSVVGVGSSTLTVTIPTGAGLGKSTLSVTGTGAKTGITSSTSAVLDVTNSLGAVSINFVGNGAPLNPTDVAGVAPVSNWNNITAVSSTTPVPLVNESGTTTSVAMTWAGINPWALNIPANNPNWTMMNGYLDDSDGSPISVGITGLPATANGYIVLVYADGDNGGATRDATYTVSGPGTTTTTLSYSDPGGNTFAGTFTRVTPTNAVGNYMAFQVKGTSFTLVAQPTTATDGTLRAPVNGIQIIPQ